MASIQKLNRDTWRVRVFYKEGGNRKFKTRTFHSSREAKSWATEIEAKRDDGTLIHESHDDLISYIKNWFEIYKAPKVSTATQRRYEATFHVLENYWGKRDLNSITFEDYQTFINTLAKDHSIASVQKIHSQTRAAIKRAVQTKQLETDFTDGTELSGLEPKAPEQKYLEIDDMKKLLGYTAHNVNTINNTSNAMIATALLTGMRYEEIVGLTWDNIDFNNNWIHIKKAYSQVDAEFIPTKNKSSIRNIQMTPTLANVLNQWRNILTNFLHDHHYTNPHDFVFYSRQRSIISTNRVNAALRKLCEQLKLKKSITFHGLRHTHASYLIATGSSIQYVSKHLGHQNTVVTQQVYAHLLEDDKIKEERMATEQLENL